MGQNLRLLIDFAGHRYNNAAATQRYLINFHAIHGDTKQFPLYRMSCHVHAQGASKRLLQSGDEQDDMVSGWTRMSITT